MSYNNKPDAEYVQRFAKSREQFWTKQRALDELVIALYMRRNYMDVALSPGQEPPRNAPPIKRLTTGLAGLAIDQDYAFVNTTPYLHINAPSTDIRDQDKADGIMEPFFNEAMLRSQHGGKVLPRSIFDLRLLGRGCFDLYPLPQAWGTDEYKKFVEEWNMLVAEGEDADAIKDAADLVQAYRRDNFPLRWRYLPATNVWPLMSSERRIPEAVQIYEMALADIEAEYGEDAIPGPYRGAEQGSTKLPVYVYSNHAYQSVVVGDKEDPREARKPFEHNLGMNPVVIMEAELFPANSQNLRWKSGIYHVQEICETIDEIVAQLRSNFRTYTLSPLIAIVNPEIRGIDPITASRGYELPITPEGQIVLYTGEDLKEAPLPKINQESILLLERLMDIVKMAVDRPVQRGQGLSGQSAAHFSDAVRMAAAEFDPTIEAIKDGMEEWYRLACRCIRKMSADEKTEDDPNPKVYITLGGKRGSIGISGKDVVGWEQSVDAIVTSKLPFSESEQMNLAVKAQGIGLDPPFVYQRYLKIENPLQRWREGKKFQIIESLADYWIQAVQQKAGVILQKLTPQEIDQLGLDIQGLPPEVQAGLAMTEQPEIPGNVLQTIPNELRRGIPEEIVGGMPVA